MEQVVFDADDLSRVVARMTSLAETGHGWMNLVPLIAGVDDERPTSLRFTTLLGGGGMGITMATWIPTDREHAEREPPRLGIAHVTGRRAVSELAARSVSLPAGWVVEQDHARRGLVVRLPAHETHQHVLEWAMGALRALIAPGVIRGWRADVYVSEGR